MENEESVEVAETAPETDEVQNKIDAAITKLQSKLEAEKKDAARLEKLSEDERAKAELDKARADLESKERELKRREMELEVTKVLNQRGIPISFMNYFITDDNETTLNNIKTFEKMFKTEIEKAVTERLKGSAPPKAGTNLEMKPARGFMETIKKNQVAR